MCRRTMFEKSADIVHRQNLGVKRGRHNFASRINSINKLADLVRAPFIRLYHVKMYVKLVNLLDTRDRELRLRTI